MTISVYARGRGQSMCQATLPITDFEARTIRKVQGRILPYIFLLYIIAVLDRVNIGFAALTMNRELAISAQQFGNLAGVFFIGYFFFEVPSNVLLHKFGARVWIARILVSWGIVAALTGFARDAIQVAFIRFLLGIAEAGFFPGMVLYMTYWFRKRERAQAVAWFMTALPISSIMGAPISGWILDHIHWMGMSSWRWLLILEAVPAIILGVVTYLILPSRPFDAAFLSQGEKDWLAAELRKEEQAAASALGHVSAWKALRHGRVWHLASIYFTILIGLYSLTFWLPQVVKLLSRSYSNTTVGLLVVIPHLCGLVAMVILSRHSDRTQERRYHAAIPAIAGGVSLLLASYINITGSKTFNNAAVAITLLSVMAVGVYSFFGPFWSLPSKFLTGFAAAAGIGLINSVGNLGGFVGPNVVGWCGDHLGNVYYGLAFVGVSMTISAFLVVLVKDKSSAQSEEPAMWEPKTS